jgi:hypothetical protein
MPAQEYYVRGINDTDARGPFTLEQLVSLAEAGQLTAEAYYFDTATEQWLAISNNPEMKVAIWPEKKQLSFKAVEFRPINQPNHDDVPITVQQFLAAAEGKTEETKGRKDSSIRIMQAAIWGTRAAAITMLISAAAMVLPSSKIIMALEYEKLYTKPLVILGLIDSLMGILLLLGLISLYPLVRFRAMFGLGFLGFIFWTQGNPTGMIALGTGCAGLYFCTIFLNYVPLGVAMLAGVCGMAALTTISFA